MTWYDDMHRRIDALERFEAEIKERMPSAVVLSRGAWSGDVRFPEFFLELDSGGYSWPVRVYTNFSVRDSWIASHLPERDVEVDQRPGARSGPVYYSAFFCDQSAAIGHVLELLRAEPDAVRRAPSP